MRERRASRRPGETIRGSRRASRGRRTAEWVASGAPCQVEVEDITSCGGWKRRAISFRSWEIETDSDAVLPAKGQRKYVHPVPRLRDGMDAIGSKETTHLCYATLARMARRSAWWLARSLARGSRPRW